MKTKFKIGNKVRQNNIPKSLYNMVYTIIAIEEFGGKMCYTLKPEYDGYAVSGLHCPIDADNLELVNND